MFVYGFSNQKITRLHLLFRSGATRPDHGNRGKTQLSDKKARAVAYMKMYFEQNADKMPDPSGNTDSWHLNAALTGVDVHRSYMDFYTQRACPESDLATCDTFKKWWREEFPHVSIPEMNKFAQCTTYVSHPSPQTINPLSTVPDVVVSFSSPST